MRSKTSFFNSAVLKGDLRCSWPLWAGYSLLWVLIAPVSLLLNNRAGMYSYESSALQIRCFIVSLSSASSFLGAFYGCAVAMLLFSALYQTRAAVGVHSLPVTRPQLFGSHCVSALCMILLPAALVFVLTLPVLAVLGVPATGLLLRLCLVMVGSFVWCFSFAVFCGMFTGQILAVPVFYFALSILPALLESMWESFCYALLYGFMPNPRYHNVALALSPLVKMPGALQAVTDEPTGNVTMTGIGWIAVYALAGLVLLAVSLQLYKRRKLEKAGETVTVPMACTLFRFGVGFCAAGVSSLSLSSILGVSGNGLGYIACLLPGAFFGFFGAEMLLRKSLQVFTKRLFAQLAALIAFWVLLLGLLSAGGLGYVTRIPEAANVSSVEVNVGQVFGDIQSYDVHFTVTDPAQVEALTRYHADYVDAYSKVEKQRQEDFTAQYEDDNKAWSVDYSQTALQLTYQLNNGKKVYRNYNVYFVKDALANPDTLESRLQAFVNENYDLIQLLKDYRTRFELSVSEIAPTGGYTTNTAGYGKGSSWANKILDAMFADLNARGKVTVSFLQPEKTTFRYSIDASCLDGDDWKSFTIQVNADKMPQTDAVLADALSSAPQGESDPGAEGVLFAEETTFAVG